MNTMTEDIEAIKIKIERAMGQVPTINNQIAWNYLLNRNVLTRQEMNAITNQMSSSAFPTNQQTGKKRFDNLISSVDPTDTYLFSIFL